MSGTFRFKGRLLLTDVNFSVVTYSYIYSKRKKKKLPQIAVWDGGWADASGDGGRTIVVGMEVMRCCVSCVEF